MLLGVVIGIIGAIVGVVGIIISIILSKRTLERILEIVEKATDKKIYIDGIAHPKEKKTKRLTKKGLMAMARYKWSKAINSFEKALTTAEGSEKAVLYNLIGLCYHIFGELTLALKNYDTSLSFAREVKDRAAEAQALDNIGLIYKTRGELDKALKYLEEALKIYREMDNKEGEAQALGNIGLIYAEKGEKEKALFYFNRALEIFKQIGAQREIVITENNIRKLQEEK